MAKSVQKIAENEIDTLEKLCFVLRRNGRTNWQLMLLFIRIHRIQVNSQAPGSTDFRRDVK